MDNKSTFAQYIIEHSSSVGGDELLCFEENTEILSSKGFGDLLYEKFLSDLLLIWGEVEVINFKERIYKAWYIDTRKIIEKQPLILWATNSDYVERLNGVGNYKLKLLLLQLRAYYDKTIPSIEFRFTDSNTVKKATNYDNVLPCKPRERH